jgi:hypothetical protein
LCQEYVLFTTTTDPGRIILCGSSGRGYKKEQDSKEVHLVGPVSEDWVSVQRVAYADRRRVERAFGTDLSVDEAAECPQLEPNSHNQGTLNCVYITLKQMSNDGIRLIDDDIRKCHHCRCSVTVSLTILCAVDVNRRTAF